MGVAVLTAFTYKITSSDVRDLEAGLFAVPADMLRLTLSDSSSEYLGKRPINSVSKADSFMLSLTPSIQQGESERNAFSASI